MATWRNMNPTWEHWVWRSYEVMVAHPLQPVLPPGEPIPASIPFLGDTGPWPNQRQLKDIREWNGKGDLMRYAVLERFGGVYADADSECVRPLDDHFIEGPAWVTQEGGPSPDLTGAFMGSEPGSTFLKALVAGIPACNMREAAWLSVGPRYLTNLARMAKPHELRVYPPNCFTPEHFSGAKAPPSEYPTYAKHYFLNTTSRYGRPEYT